MAGAEVRVAEDIYIPRIHVASIETCGCVADWDPVRQQLTLHLTSQAPHAIRTVLALVAAAPACRSTSTTSGSRPTTSAASAARSGLPGLRHAVAASFLTGKPVKWIEDRSENLQADSFARDYHIHAEMGATKDGKITGLKVKTIADHGYSDAAADPSKFPAGLFNVITGSYDFDNAFVEVDGVYEQAAGRRRLPLLVPGDRGRSRDRADGRHPRPRDRQGSRPAPVGELHQPEQFPTRRRPAGSTTPATTPAP